MNDEVRRIFRLVLDDIRVELGDEFDKNFERQAFFSESWARRRSPVRQGGALLVDTGTLRRSIRSRTTDDSITFYTYLPYAAIHNDGGEIVVTRRMKGYFWHKYMTAAGALQFARRKDGTMRRDKNTLHINDEAEFYKCMALKKEGSTVKIPRRRFLGTSPEVERAVREIIEENLEAYFRNVDFTMKRK